MTSRELLGLSYLAAVVQAGSFTRAAARLGVTRSALSHSVKALENQLGVRLLHRTTRNLSLTTAGVGLVETLIPAFDAIAGSLEALTHAQQRPAGRLRITLPRVAATLVVATKLARFLQNYPNIEIDLSVDDAMVDIVAAGFDAGIRFRERLAASMIAVPISDPVAFAVVGSPTYFADRPPVATPQDLMGQACIRYRMKGSGRHFDWEFQQGCDEITLAVPGQLTLDAPEFMVRAALDGIGLAYVPLRDVEQYLAERRLVRVLEDWCPPVARLYLYYPTTRLVPPALRLFIEQMKQRKN